jgi:hypothetical protein
VTEAAGWRREGSLRIHPGTPASERRCRSHVDVGSGNDPGNEYTVGPVSHRACPRPASALRFLVVGFALVANAAAVHASDVGGERYRYDTARLTATESGVEFGSDSPVDAVPDRTDGIDCLLTQQRPRLCAFEAHAVQTADGPGTVRIAAEGRFEVSPYSESIAPYTLIDGQAYRRRYDLSDRTTTVGLEPVPTDAAVENVAVDPSSLSPAAARVVDSGPTTLRRPLPAHGRVVDTAEGYVVVVGDDDPVRGERPLRQAAAVVGQLGVGALLLRRGGREFVEIR